MINKIDISNFGSFKNFIWDNSVKDSNDEIVSFKKLNILYGRNYSGKTTLSRIVRSLKTGIISKKYEFPSFVLKLNSGDCDENSIPVQGKCIRVYNKDFVDEHLGFLRDDDGEVSPFAIIGGENKTIEKEITKIEEKLGSVDAKAGVRYQYEIRNLKYNEKNKEQEKLSVVRLGSC
jgi:wobble nucleotide-excising tRNase